MRRSLRKKPSDAESLLWYHLRDRRLGDMKFRRQHQIGPYYVDFACVDWKLIVEVDGSQHLTDPGLEGDAGRTAYLSSLEWRVLRFTNVEVLTETVSVLEVILAASAPSP